MDLVHISIGNAGITAFLGYMVVFFGLILLMIVVILMGRYFIAKNRKEETKVQSAPVSAPAEVKKPEAAGTAGELKLYDTDPKDAAMIMAIVADTLGKPINQLRFISIKEVKD